MPTDPINTEDASAAMAAASASAIVIRGGGGGGERRRHCRLPAPLLMLLLLALALARDFPTPFAAVDASEAEADADDDDDDDDPSSVENKCTLYLAPSSIPHAGLGTYTSIPLSPRQIVGPPEPLINVLDLPFHTSPEESNGALLADYDWAGVDYLAHLEARKVQAMIPGMGAAINSHPGLYNVAAGHPAVDSAGLSRYREEEDDDESNSFDPLEPGDPGVGAFTYYHSLRSLAARSLPAGAELFAHYSDPYFLDRTDDFGYIPLAQDFDDADRIVTKFDRYLSENEGTERELNEEQLKDLWEMTVRGSFDADVRTKRLREALPGTVRDARRAAAGTGTADLSLPSHVRGLEWLEKYGMCVDTVRPGPSAIRQAGRGGFAARPVAEGEIVLPLPLLHVNRTLLDMRALRPDPEFEGRLLKGKDVVGRQLLLNYCYGHKDSSVLLLPYSTGSANINHAPTGDGANVKLRWHVPTSTSTEGEEDDTDDEEEKGVGAFHHPEWLDLDASDIFTKMKTGLLMELVATRPIDEGEELLLDYGKDWSDAWNEHVRDWPSKGPHGYGNPEKNRPYGYPHELNEDKFSPVKTHAEQTGDEDDDDAGDPYPPNVATACFYNAVDEGHPLSPNALRRRIPVDPSDPSRGIVTAIKIPWDGEGMGELSHPTLRPCSIVSREERVNDRDERNVGRRSVSFETTELVYTALMEPWEGDIPDDERHVVYDMPRDGIALVDRSYSSDQHLGGAFRQEIGVPDGVFPEAWKDLA
mmetsp:Transcript_30420/g.90794  ORF Transcript_30420/g.90794 Transcript_30420/m.90794 type:complete len:758 (-) Transcript_30420:287-2560(-)